MFEEEVNPENIKIADFVIGIPSYLEADNISYPTAQIDKGLVKFFPKKRCVIINCDSDSPDDTKRAFLNTPTNVPKIYLSTPPGVKGKGRGLWMLFKKALELEAEVVATIDADLESVTPAWIKHLCEPILEGFSLVAAKSQNT